MRKQKPGKGHVQGHVVSDRAKTQTHFPNWAYAFFHHISHPLWEMQRETLMPKGAGTPWATCPILPTPSELCPCCPPGTAFQAYRAALIHSQKQWTWALSCKIFIWNMCVTEQVSHPEVASLYIVQRNTRAPRRHSSSLCWCDQSSSAFASHQLRPLVPPLLGLWPQLATGRYHLSFPQDPLYLPWMLMVPKEVLSRCEVSVGLQGLVFTKF